MSKKVYKIDNRSTIETFLRWLDECGNDLINLDGILSLGGITDGPDIVSDCLDIHEEDEDGNFGRYIDFNKPEEVDDFLNYDEYYDSGHRWYGEYLAPSIHYIDWFKKNYP